MTYQDVRRFFVLMFSRAVRSACLTFTPIEPRSSEGFIVDFPGQSAEKFTKLIWMKRAPMTQGSYDHVQLTAIKLAAERVAESLGAKKEKDRLIVSRAVFEIAAEANIFDSDRLVELALEKLSPKQGWRFK